MKTNTLLQKLLAIILVFSGISALAQQNYHGTPYKMMDSPVYGTDILIQGNASEDQRAAKVVIAPNGWIYAAYMISSGGMRIAKSTDYGTTWSYSATLRSGYYLNAIDIAVTGTDSNSINIWTVSAGFMKASIDVWNVSVEKLNQQMTLLSTVQIDQMISNFGFPDVAIATDYAFPSIGASPFSIGIIYSKILAVNDEVIFVSSSDGGNSFNNTRMLAATGQFFINVSLSFGRSASFPEGRYFAAWDKQPSFSYYDGYFGKIYCAHSLSQFNGNWSAPYQLDTIGGGFPNGAKDPSISCQADQLNNSSNSFSVVVTYDKILNASGANTCVFGVGNLDPVNSGPWTAAFSSGTGNIRDIEPDITYDRTHQKFYVAWSDSLNAKLKCAVNDMNLQTTGAWAPISDGFNDAPYISHPFPKVKVNPVSKQVVHVWDGHRSPTITNATFDKSDLYVGLADPNPAKRFSFSVYPNPCRIETTLSFSLNKEEVVSASMYDLSGRQVWNMPSQMFLNGNHEIRLNTASLDPGCYIVQLHAGTAAGCQRIVVTPN